jgi:hypothetical protein
MRVLMVSGVALLLLASCAAEKADTPVAGETAPAIANDGATTATLATPTATAPAPEPAPAADEENNETNTWAGQVKIADAESTFNYVGAESGDWVPMRFRNDSEAGKKILAACGNDDECEFKGAVQWLDETPPPDASAVARIVRVDSVKRLPPAAR